MSVDHVVDEISDDYFPSLLYLPILHLYINFITILMTCLARIVEHLKCLGEVQQLGGVAVGFEAAWWNISILSQTGSLVLQWNLITYCCWWVETEWGGASYYQNGGKTGQWAF